MTKMNKDSGSGSVPLCPAVTSVSRAGEAALTRVRDTDLNLLRDIQQVAE